MVPDISTGSRTRGLLAYLYGPGRRDEHTDPHIVAAWDTAGAPDPGRDDEATLTQLAKRLDHHVRLRAGRQGETPPQHVWHCPVRTAPEDRYLTDTEWAEVARRIVAATGIAPDGDESACRWIAVRHADDHIHIVATTVRADGRRPRRHADGRRAQAECRRIEEDLGLRRLNSGDHTAAPTPTSAEQAKAQRHGHAAAVRVELRERVRLVLVHAESEEEFFSVLTSLGTKVKLRTVEATGDILGYALALPGDVNADGQPVYYGGSKLAPDLSLPRIREALAAKSPSDDHPCAPLPATSPWQQAEHELRHTHAMLTEHGADEATQGQLAAVGALLDATAAHTPGQARTEVRAAARAFERATRSAIRADHRQAAELRASARRLLRSAADPNTDHLAGLLTTLILVAIAAQRWHTAHRHQQQAAAAQRTLAHLHTAYQHTAHPVLADLARRTPSPTIRQHLATQVRTAVPDHAERILTDPAWPALATALAQAQTAGHQPRQLLGEIAGQRELGTAKAPAEVLLWRIRNTPSKQAQRATAAQTHTTQETAGPTTSHADTGSDLHRTSHWPEPPGQRRPRS